MKFKLVSLLIILMLLGGCAAPAGVRMAQDHLSNQEYVKAAEVYSSEIAATQDAKKRMTLELKLSEVKSLIATQYIGHAQAQLNASGDPTRRDLQGQIQYLSTVLKWDDANSNINSEIERLNQFDEYLQEQANKLLVKAISASHDYQYDEAIQLLAKAKIVNDVDEALIAAETKILGQRKAYWKIESLLGSKQLTEAMEVFKLLSSSFSEPLDLCVAPFKQQALLLIRNDVDDMTHVGNWSAALDYLGTIQCPELDEKIATTRQLAADHFYTVAAQALKVENPHKAYLYANRAIELLPGSIDLFNLRKLAKDGMDKSIQSHIAVASFESPSNDVDAGRQFSDSLISYLYQVLPYGINILEREKIDYVLNENQSGTRQIGDILGADLVVTGAASLFKVDNDTDQRTATVKVTLGEEVVENPVFSQNMKLYGTDLSTWPEIPPKTIQKGEVELIRYTKGTGKKKGFAKVSVRIFDTEKGTITFVKDYEANITKISEFQDEVADAGIEYIPLNLPTDTELKEEMRKGIVAEVAKVVQASFDNREIRFLNQVNFYLTRREYDAALIPLAQGYYYCLQDGIPSDNEYFVAMTNRIKELIR